MKINLFKAAQAAAFASLLPMSEPLVPLEQQSNLLLQERAPGIFGVQVFDGPTVAAEGTYFEVLRLEEPQPGGGPDGSGSSTVFTIECAVTAGLLLGSTGSILPVFGIKLRTTNESPSGRTVIEGFMPYELSVDLGSAMQGAHDLHAWLGGAAPLRAGGDPRDAFDFCHCQEKLDNDGEACAGAAALCTSVCLRGVYAAIAACEFTWPLVPACRTAAHLTFMSCLRSCRAAHQACLSRAAQRSIDCMSNCYYLVHPGH